ncbi:MAG TPA: WYL domain-containing protein, partial [Chlorobaculum sp.]|nr:WYL domain-containing protein [Chlorobaculum sp.]
MLHAPIDYDRKMRGYFYKDDWVFNPSSFLDQQEVEALAVTSKVLSQYKGTPYYEEISRAIEKLMQYLPVSFSEDGLFEIYSFENPFSASNLDHNIVSLLEQAGRNSRKVTMTYNASSRRTITERTVHPYRLHYDQSAGTWYLIAYCEYRREVRTFAICRIHNLVITSEHFTIQESFDIADYLEKAFDLTSGTKLYDISIRFTPYQSQWIREHRWHPTQQIEEHEDGSLTLRL